MIQTNADIVAGDSGGPLSSSGGVIGMDTAGNSPSSSQQLATGFAIPINTALSIARQITASRGSATVAIGYPGFMGIYLSSGSDASPQDQRRSSNSSNNSRPDPPGTPACSTSNAGLSVPSAIAPASSGVLIDGTICGGPAAEAGMTSGAVITAVNRRAVGSPDDLNGVLARFHPRNRISVTWVSPLGFYEAGRPAGIRLSAGPPQ